jgi:lipopolysaccharide biosynthesis protein
MKSLCLYASYVHGKGISYYSSVYLKELKNKFSDVIYLHSNKLDSLANDFFEAQGIETKLVSNDGFDFGKWQKIMNEVDLTSYEQLVLVNDSCVLFAPLDNVIGWFNNSGLDFGGLTSSMVPKNHIQSYFLMFNKITFNELVFFLKKNSVTNNIHEVIEHFEIGLSQYLLSKNFKCGSFLSNDGYAGEFSPYYQCVNSHIKQGSPLIKKKILFSSYRKDELFTLARMNFNIKVKPYLHLIAKCNQTLIISFDELFKHEKNKMSLFVLFKYTITRFSIYLYRQFNK